MTAPQARLVGADHGAVLGAGGEAVPSLGASPRLATTERPEQLTAEGRTESPAAEAVEHEDGSVEHVVAEANENSLSTLKTQMYIGWVAILALCGLVVGRRLCRRQKKGAKIGRGL